MPKKEMMKVDWWKDVAEAANPKYITSGPQKITIVGDFPKDIWEKFGTTAKGGENDLLDSKVWYGGRKVYDKFVTSVAKDVEETEKKLEKIAKDLAGNQNPTRFAFLTDSVKENFRKRVEQKVKALPAEVQKGYLQAYDDFMKVKKENRSNKLKLAVNVGGKIAGIGFNIAGLIGTGGANLLNWRGLIKDTIGLLQTSAAMMLSTEKVRKAIDLELKAVKKIHKALGNGKGATASEVGLALLKTATGLDVMTTLDSLQENVRLYKARMIGLDSHAQSLGKKVTKLQNELDAAMRKAPEQAENGFLNLKKKVNDLLDKVSSLSKKVEEGREWVRTMDKQIADMKAAKKVTALDKIFKVIDSAADIVTGGLSWDKMAKGTETVAKTVAEEAVSLVKNLESWEGEMKALKKAG